MTTILKQVNRIALSRDELMKLYWEENLSTYRISRLVGKDRATIINWMETYGIRRKSIAEWIKLRTLPGNRYRASPSVEELQELYCEKRLSQEQIAKHFHSCTTTVRRWLRQAGIRARTPAETNRGKVRPRGEKSPGWKGGIKKRGDYICLYKPEHPRADSLGYVAEHILVWEETHNRPLPQGYVVHHINGLKADNRPDNLIALPRGKHYKVIPELAKRIRQLEIENRQLRRALDNSQMIFYINDN